MVKRVAIALAIALVVALLVMLGSALFGVAQNSGVAVAIGAVAGASYAVVTGRQSSGK